MKRLLEPNTTLHTVPVALLTCSGGRPNAFALNRISSCSAEPPMLAISVRPMQPAQHASFAQGDAERLGLTNLARA